MNNIVADFELETKSTEIELELEQKSFDASFEIISGGGGGSTYHDQLEHRDFPNQHPMSAITGLDDALSNLADDIIAENNRAVDAEESLQDSINAEKERAERIEAEISGNLFAEKTAREDADKELSDKIDTVEDDLTEDIDSLANIVDSNYSTLSNRITEVASELEQTIEENVVALQQEDTALQNQINVHSATLTAHDTRITNNANAITQEVTDRQSADDNLQEQIDGITAGSDVKDIVGTYAELQQYDKSTLSDNDIIKVLQDETKEGASTYYRYIASTQSFEYIGKEGPYYTKSEADALLGAKQDTISDLVTIRNNASDGKVASETIATYGNIVTHNADEFQPVGDYATKTELSQGLATKQNTLISGTNIKTLNNASLLGSGNIDITSAQWGNITGTLENQTDLQTELDNINNKIKEMELYKTPNVLIEGEPSINNGQVTGFSRTNYLILPFQFDVGERGFEFTYCFRTGVDVTTPQNLYGSKFSIASYVSGGKLTVRVSSNGASWDVLDLVTSLDVQPNTTYYIKLIFNRLNYTVKASTDGETYSQIGYVVNTGVPFKGDVFIGIGNNQNNPFLGMINLHKWELKYNNSVFWEGMDDAGLATRADISLSNLDDEGQAKFDAKQDVISDLDTIRSNAQDGKNIIPQVEVNTQRIEDLTIAKFPNVVIVGTPHIEGGQVSNYSDTSYLQFPFVDISRGQPFDIYFSFTTAQDITTQQNVLDAHFGIALAVQNGKGVMALSSNGTSWDIGTTTGTNTLLPNTTYYVKYSWTGTQYNASLSTNDQEYVPDMTINSNLSPYKTTIFIGGSPNIFGAGSAHPFKGTINFNKSKVVVNGITVWEGMADVGLASRANVSLNNLDEVGEARFTDIQDAIDGKQPIGDYALKSELPTLARDNVPGLVAGGNWLTVNQTTGKMECGELTKAQFDSALGYTFVGKTTLNNVLIDKQDKLTAGDGIEIVDNIIATTGITDGAWQFLNKSLVSGGTLTRNVMYTYDLADIIPDDGLYECVITLVGTTGNTVDSSLTLRVSLNPNIYSQMTSGSSTAGSSVLNAKNQVANRTQSSGNVVHVYTDNGKIRINNTGSADATGVYIAVKMIRKVH